MIEFILGIITVAFGFYIMVLLLVGTANLYYRLKDGSTGNQKRKASENVKSGMARLSDVEKRTK